MDKNLERLNAELAWAHVASKKVELEEAVKPSKKAKKKIEAVKVHIDTNEAAVQDATANLEALSANLPPEMSEDEKIELTTIRDELKRVKQEVTTIKGDKKNVRPPG